MTTNETNPIKLYKCEPEYWMFLPKILRHILAWVTIILFSCSFLTIPFCVIFLIPYVWKIAPITAGICLSTIILSMFAPLKEWPWFRKIGQLWYEIFDFSCNKSPEDNDFSLNYGDDHKLIICMHPHGIVPFHAILWAAYCDQYCSRPNLGKKLYGFGAAADAVMYVPILRNIMGWLSAGSADYKVLKDGLVKGICKCVNAAGRIPRHLYILPGGIAEVFTSQPGKHVVVFKKRRGLIKLSIETGANLIPCYVFGGTDFFHNLATDAGIFSSLSRKLRMGLTLFWGPCGLPIPYTPKVTTVIGMPIPPPIWDISKGPIPTTLIDELHEKFLHEMIVLFDKYKEIAGYPNATLEVQ